MGKVVTITVTGLRAAAIEEANRAHPYGIHAYRHDTRDGLIAAEAAVRDYLAENKINWNSFEILRTRTIDTTGTKTPYKATVTFVYDLIEEEA